MKRLAFIWMISLALLLSGAGAALWSGHTRLVSDITSLFPQDHATSLEALALEQSGERLARNVVVLVGHAQEPVLQAAQLQLKADLGKIEHIRVQDISRKSIENLQDLQAGGIGSLASWDDYNALKKGEGLPLIQRALAAFYLPGSLINSDQIHQDPLGLYQRFLFQMSKTLGQATLKGDDGNFYAQIAISLLDLQANPNGGDPLSSIDQALEKIRSTHPDLKLHVIGSPYYARAIAEISKSEATTITAIAIAGILILLLIAFRSAHSIFGALITISTGVLCGAGATVLLFDNVHVIAIAFGSTLVGVVVDYAIHFYFLRRGPENAVQTAGRIKSGLLMAIGTTVAGFCALLFVDIEVLRQISVYSIFGVLGAGVTVLLILPMIPGTGSVQIEPQQPASKIRRYHYRWLTPRQVPLLAVLGAVFLGLIGFEQLPSDDTVQNLRVSTPTLSATENLIARLGGTAHSRLLLVKGETAQEILQREDQVQSYVQQNASAVSMLGVSSIIPSISRQAETCRLSRELLNTKAAKPLLKLVSNQIEACGELELTDAAWSQLPDFVQQLWVTNDEGQAHLVLLSGVGPDFNIEDLMERLPYVSLLDVAAHYKSGFGKMRHRATLALIFGIVVMVLAFMLKFGLRRGLGAVIVPVFSALSALTVAAFMGSGLTLFSVMAGFLVFALGADYSLFQLAAHKGDEDRAYFAVGLSSLSTLLVFALLSGSAIPVLQSMGVVVVVGVAIAWLIAPVASIKFEGESV